MRTIPLLQLSRMQSASDYHREIVPLYSWRNPALKGPSRTKKLRVRNHQTVLRCSTLDSDRRYIHQLGKKKCPQSGTYMRMPQQQQKRQSVHRWQACLQTETLCV